MNEIHHKILSDLHGILSCATSEQLLSASLSPGVTTHMKYALEELAKERATTVNKKRASQISEIKPSSSSDRKRKSTEHRLRTTSRLNDETKHMVWKMLNDSPRFAKKGNVVHFARSVGIRLDIQAKDGKKRVVSKFIASLETLSRPRLSRVLRQLFPGQDKQTEGWIELITNGR